ncbi:hypothetical protein L7F22_020629 [Adiantum nelumboides]|nr:hypothetical protein [Adiantum nelumboides]
MRTTTTVISSRATRPAKKQSSSDNERIDTDKEESPKGLNNESPKGSQAKGPSKFEKSNEEDTSTPLERKGMPKTKVPRLTVQVAYVEAQARVDERRKKLAATRQEKNARTKREKNLEEQRVATLAWEKIKEGLKRTAKQAVLEPQEGEPKRQQQEEKENIENRKMDPTTPSLKSPVPPRSPPPPVSTPAPTFAQHPKSLAPSSPQQKAQSIEEFPIQPPSQVPDIIEVPKQDSKLKGNMTKPKLMLMISKKKEQGTRGVLKPHSPGPPQETMQIYLATGEALKPRALSPNSSRRVHVPTLIIQIDLSQEEAYEFKERFLAGLTPILREKVKCKFPESFKEALIWARLKDRKLQFQRSWRDHSQAASRVTTQEQAHPSSPNGSGDPHLDRLRRVTKQLDSLSINLIHGLQLKQPVQQQAGGQGPNDEVPRRPPRREYQCHNYGEDEHCMYFCPYPRGYGNAPPRGSQQQFSPPRMRPPPMPICEQQQQPQQHQTIQISRQSTYAPVPQSSAEVPSLPHDGVERAMNVIGCEDKGEEKIMEAEATPSKEATVAEEPCQMTTNDGANKKEKKRKKKVSMTRRKIGIINFPVKSKPQDLIEEVQRQEPKLTWPQLLHLSPRMRRQWSKMVSTRRSKSVNTLKAQVLEDDVPVLDTQIKGQRVSSDYVDGGEQVCVISKKMMHKLRLEVSEPSRFKGNDVSVKYAGVVTVCGIQFGVDMYVLLARGEGYPIILGRPWLIAMNAKQDWESRTLLLKPPRKEGKSIQTIVYNVKEGRKESSELETLEDEWSTEDSSSTAEVTSSVSDSESEKSSLLEAMVVVLTRFTTQDGGSIKETLSDEKIEDMLSTDLSKEERKEFEVMLQKHSPLFILDYKQIKGVIVVEHQINLKPESQPIAHRVGDASSGLASTFYFVPVIPHLSIGLSQDETNMEMISSHY